MSSSCFRGCRFDLEIVKSPSASSTLSESSSSHLASCARKPRTPRKRPNQTYNEAAALLSTAYPTVFSAKLVTKPHRFTRPLHSFWDESSSDLLLPFRVFDHSGFLLHRKRIDPKPYEKACHSPGEIDSQSFLATGNSSLEVLDDFDTESILDDEIEIEEGILDSIMGKSTSLGDESDTGDQFNSWFGNPMGLGFERGVRQVDESNWWCSPTVDVQQISPRLIPPPPEISTTKPLLLKLNYEQVMNAWSGRGSPFQEERTASVALDSDVPSVPRKSKSKKN